MHNSGVLFSVLELLQIKEGGLNFWLEPILQNVWIISSPILCFNFKSFLDPNSSSFLRFKCILHQLGVFFSESSNVYKFKRGRPNFWEKSICREFELFGHPFCISILKVFSTQLLHSYFRFQWILHNLVVLSSELSNFYKLKRRDLISGGTNFAECLNYLVPPSVFQL